MTASPPPAPQRRRDSARTRRRLLDAARHLFAQNGYSGTPVRDIADSAGVNVALINRYFESKEGLFAACLTAAVDDLRTTTTNTPLDAVPAIIAGQIAGYGIDGDTGGGHYEHLLLLVRSSGDERADQIRVEVLRTYGEGLAARAGWRPDAPGGDDVLLRAQLVLGAAIGAVLLRTSGLQPLASAPAQDLVDPLRALVASMLPTA